MGDLDDHLHQYPGFRDTPGRFRAVGASRVKWRALFIGLLAAADDSVEYKYYCTMLLQAVRILYGGVMIDR